RVCGISGTRVERNPLRQRHGSGADQRHRGEPQLAIAAVRHGDLQAMDRRPSARSGLRGRSKGRAHSERHHDPIDLPRLSRLQQAIRVLRAACILALALGYAAFYSIFPSATFPVSGDASFPWIFLVLAAASVLGAMEAGELQEAVVAAMLALPLGYLVAVLL